MIRLTLLNSEESRPAYVWVNQSLIKTIQLDWIQECTALERYETIYISYLIFFHKTVKVMVQKPTYRYIPYSIVYIDGHTYCVQETPEQIMKLMGEKESLNNG